MDVEQIFKLLEGLVCVRPVETVSITQTAMIDGAEHRTEIIVNYEREPRE